jgi:hypothetical protein
MLFVFFYFLKNKATHHLLSNFWTLVVKTHWKLRFSTFKRKKSFSTNFSLKNIYETI